MNITSAESAVMDVLWRLGPRDAEEITAALADSQAWSGTTVRTRYAVVNKGLNSTSSDE